MTPERELEMAALAADLLAQPGVRVPVFGPLAEVYVDPGYTLPQALRDRFPADDPSKRALVRYLRKGRGVPC